MNLIRLQGVWTVIEWGRAFKNMALHKSQRTKTLNSELMEGFNIVFFFSFVNNIGANWQIDKLAQSGNWRQAK
jgi:hypothetical protein